MEPWAKAQEVLADGGVAFTASRDGETWPWLALDPHDPIVIQTINFWASYQCGEARGGWEPGQWTALTWMEWQAGAPGCGHATHGVEDVFEKEGEHFYRLTFFDDAGALVARMTGKGVVFRNRDFEGWRAKEKKRLQTETIKDAFAFAPVEQVGASTANGSLLSALSTGKAPSARGLITAKNGLAPGNPHLSGSGDHVNATHLAEVMRQFDTLLRGGDKRLPRGGEMRFMRYVELGVPLTVSLKPGCDLAQCIEAEVHQAGRLCTTGRFDF
ncbi:hypothetical protein ELI_11455 [Erythrobacter litoralis HTCC2594]|uniref:Uncharacterized protein n=2 Tax=Erythrobacter litoralis TaxID=39960 RepID=Q2N7F8_ERYLH|nr:hypothetical protein ELI_11455 [Erythrobacter litoralis HTCC2594]